MGWLLFNGHASALSKEITRYPMLRVIRLRRIFLKNARCQFGLILLGDPGGFKLMVAHGAFSTQLWRSRKEEKPPAHAFQLAL